MNKIQVLHHFTVKMVNLVLSSAFLFLIQLTIHVSYLTAFDKRFCQRFTMSTRSPSANVWEWGNMLLLTFTEMNEWVIKLLIGSESCFHYAAWFFGGVFCCCFFAVLGWKRLHIIRALIKHVTSLIICSFLLWTFEKKIDCCMYYLITNKEPHEGILV